MNFIALIGIVKTIDQKTKTMTIQVEKPSIDEETKKEDTNWYYEVKVELSKELAPELKSTEIGDIVGLKGYHNGKIIVIERYQKF